MARPAQVLTDDLAAFTSWDVDRARALVAEDFSFEGPFLRSRGRDTFFAGAAGLAPIVRGRTMLRQWEDADEVSSVYESELHTPVGAGTVLMSEWHTVRDDRLTASRLVFDTAQFRKVVPAPR